MVQEVFVFGSNLAGRHGKGAALYASRNYGAERGVGRGPTGMAYAIPTKDEALRPLPLPQVAENIAEFLVYARARGNTRFLLTPVGTGLAGNAKSDIWSILKAQGVPENVVLTASWVSG